MATHHHYEERELFPNLDKAAGKTGLIDGAAHEHEAFQGGLDKCKMYLSDKGADGFSAAELIATMDEFKDPLYSHLKAEPPAIAALVKYSSPDNPIDILGIADAVGNKQVSLRFIFNTLPVFFLNMETVGFEGGTWHGVFPPLNGVAKIIMHKTVPMWHSGRWRFINCDADGRAKQLAV